MMTPIVSVSFFLAATAVLMARFASADRYPCENNAGVGIECTWKHENVDGVTFCSFTKPEAVCLKVGEWKKLEDVVGVKRGKFPHRALGCRADYGGEAVAADSKNRFEHDLGLAAFTVEVNSPKKTCAERDSSSEKAAALAAFAKDVEAAASKRLEAVFTKDAVKAILAAVKAAITKTKESIK